MDSTDRSLIRCGSIPPCAADELSLTATSDLVDGVGAKPVEPVTPVVPIQRITKGQGILILLLQYQ